jgi:hypothetical protein
LYYVKTRNTAGTIEVHTATAASGYTSAGIHSASRFPLSDADNGVFGLLPNGDLYYVKTRNTAGTIEVHTATAASGYTSAGIDAASWISTGDADNGVFGLLPNGDLYYVKTRNTAGTIEVHTATAASGYASVGIHAASWISAAEGP